MPAFLYISLMLCTLVEAPARLLQTLAIAIELPVGITFWIALGVADGGNNRRIFDSHSARKFTLSITDPV
jgi:hypothetical protein